MKQSGLLLINKPEGPSSFDEIRALRKRLHIKKMGHAGTLDPLASGLMVIAVGQATKLLPYLPTDKKEYEFTIQFGETRTTGDREGEILERGFAIPGEGELQAVLPLFRGEIEQVPPIYSAIKIEGKRAYELAREGKSVEMQSRAVTVYALDLISYNQSTGVANMLVQCSAGTYVRSLAQDIAHVLGSGAYASRIHRTKVGSFSLDRAVAVDAVEGVEALVDPGIVMTQWSTQVLSGRELELFRNGNAITLKTVLPKGDLVWVTDDFGVPVALAKQKQGVLSPVRVFPSW